MKKVVINAQFGGFGLSEKVKELLKYKYGESISEDVKYTIEEYDGAEWIDEIHRKWD